MNLFNEKKNGYFACSHELVNRAIDKGGLTINEIKGIVSEHGFYEYDHEFVQAIIGNSNDVFTDIQLFNKIGDKYVPVIQTRVPLVFSTIEKQWLNSMLKQDGVTTFIQNETLQKLQDKLNNDKRDSDLADMKFDSDGCFSDEVKENINIVIKAYITNSYIVFDNHALNGNVYKDSQIIPYRIEFSSQLKGFWLIGYEQESKLMLKVSMERIVIKDIIPRDDSQNIEEKAKELYKTKHITIEIVDVKGALERALHLFSEYKRDSVFDHERNIHVLNVEYYEFDEYDLLKTLYSIGTNVKVIAPEYMRQKVSDVVIKQIDMLL